MPSKNTATDASQEAPAGTPAAAPEAAPAGLAILNAETKIETNNEVIRQPFSGTKVETFDTVQTAVYGEPEFEEVEVRPGVKMRTYTGVQPGVTLTDAAGKDLA